MSWDAQCDPGTPDIERVWLMGGNSKVGYGVWGTYPAGQSDGPEVTQFLMECCRATIDPSHALANGINAGHLRYACVCQAADVLILMLKKKEGETEADLHGVVATHCIDYDKENVIYMVYRTKKGLGARPYTDAVIKHAARVRGAIQSMGQQQY